MKQKTGFYQSLSLLFCAVLLAATVLLAGCKDNTTSADSSAATAETAFTLTVVNADGISTDFPLVTTEKTVGAALLKEGLIAGENSEFGLYVKTVNGITLNYETDGKYWAFYEDGAYAAQGVDRTPVRDGGAYAFKAE